MFGKGGGHFRSCPATPYPSGERAFHDRRGTPRARRRIAPITAAAAPPIPTSAVQPASVHAQSERRIAHTRSRAVGSPHTAASRGATTIAAVAAPSTASMVTITTGEVAGARSASVPALSPPVRAMERRAGGEETLTSHTRRPSMAPPNGSASACHVVRGKERRAAWAASLRASIASITPSRAGASGSRGAASMAAHVPPAAANPPTASHAPAVRAVRCSLRGRLHRGTCSMSKPAARNAKTKSKNNTRNTEIGRTRWVDPGLFLCVLLISMSSVLSLPLSFIF